MINIIVKGPQGSGKTTQINKLLDGFGTVNILWISAASQLFKTIVNFLDKNNNGTDIVVIGEVTTDRQLRAVEQTVADLRKTINEKLIVIIEYQT